MGAHNFVDTGIGRTASEAYAAAVETAEFEYGHDAYNGTISTTNGVVDVSALLRPFSAKRRDAIAWAATSTYRLDPLDPYAEGYVEKKFETVVRDGFGRYVVPKTLRPSERETALRLAEKIEKWGPALAFEVTGVLAAEEKKNAAARGAKVRGRKVFRFFGLAAS